MEIQTTTEVKVIWRYGVRVLGVKKRCRKTEWHFTDKNDLGAPADSPSPEEAKRRALVWISENMSKVERAHATATKWTVEGIGETWLPFTEEDNLRYPLDLGNTH